MYDTIYNNQFPAGAQAYAAYVDGGLGNQPNYAYIVNTFPKAEHLSIALFSSNNADALDVEAGAATPGEIPAWCTRQRSRGIQRPCIYANASTMQGSVLPVLSEAKIARSSVRLWSAHYGLGEHICGPNSCGALSTEADGTQWTSSALGLVLDQSELQSNFFTVSPTNGAIAEAELQSGQLNTGKNAPTNIAVAPGTAHHIAFGCDNAVAGAAVGLPAGGDLRHGTGLARDEERRGRRDQGAACHGVPQPGEDRSGLGDPDGRGHVPRRLRRLLNSGNASARGDPFTRGCRGRLSPGRA